MKYTDPTGAKILNIVTFQYQNSAVNNNAHLGPGKTGEYDKYGNFVFNTVGLYGCLATAVTNIVNTINGQNSSSINEAAGRTQTAAEFSSKDYFIERFSKTTIGHDVLMSAKTITKALKKETGGAYFVQRNKDATSSQLMIDFFANNKDVKAYIIADIGGHFVNVTGYSDGKVQIHNPNKNKPNKVPIEQVRGIYLIQGM